MRSQANIDRKSLKIANVKEHLKTSQMVFAASLDGLTVANVSELKKRLPETTTVMTVKNTLMRRAIDDSEWVGLGDFTTQSNMWFFVGNEIKQTVEAYEKLCKELRRDAVKKGGMLEGEVMDENGINAVAALPSKKELIAKIAMSIKMVPTKLGRSIHAVPAKLARAIKLAIAEDGSESSESSESSGAPVAE